MGKYMGEIIFNSYSRFLKRTSDRRRRVIVSKVKLVCFICALAISVTALAATPPPQRFIDVESLSQDLRSKNIDQIFITLNDVKGMMYQGQILPFIQDLWDIRKDKHPDLPWQVIQSDIVRVEIADVLIQARDNGRINLDLTPLHNYVAHLINSSDVQVALSAISTLATIDDPIDAKAITAIAKKQDRLFRSCVSSLARMCNTAAERGLDELEQVVTNPELKSFLLNTKKQKADFNSRRCASKK